MSSRHRPFLVVLSSPSGAGKTSILRAVLRRDRSLAYSVSATTRPRRPGERDGRSYRFVTEAQFRGLVRRRALLEQARVYDTWYGTPREPVLRAFRQGRDVIADLDVQGMHSSRRVLPGTVAIFITAPDRRELDRRLRDRGTETAVAVARRRAAADNELAAAGDFDYVVVNDRLESAVADVLSIIRAERLRPARSRTTSVTPKRRTWSK